MAWIVYDAETYDVLLIETSTPEQEAGRGYFFDAEVTDFPVRTNQTFKFKFDGSKIVSEDLRTFEQVKNDHWTFIKKARQDAINASLTTPYGIFDSDAAGRTSITDAVLMLQTLASIGTPTTIDFTLADNTVVVLDTAQMVEVGLLLGQKTQTAHGQARIKREAIAAATTKESVLLISW